MKILIPNFSDYQHYRQRRPPWIKIHRKVFENYDFIILDAQAQVMLIFLWLMASENEVVEGKGVVETSCEELRWRMRLDFQVDIIQLLRILDASKLIGLTLTQEELASKPLADASRMLARDRDRDRGRGRDREPPLPPQEVIESAADAAGPGLPFDPPRRKQSWPREAATDWDERFGKGSAQPGRIGAALTKLVEAHTWEKVRPIWRRYLDEKDPTYASPQDFAAKFGAWADGSVYEGGAEGSAKTVETGNKRVLQQFLKSGTAQRQLPSGKP
jgi:hypothetical protein